MMHNILESKMLYEIKTRMMKIMELIHAVNISLDFSQYTSSTYLFGPVIIDLDQYVCIGLIICFKID